MTPQGTTSTHLFDMIVIGYFCRMEETLVLFPILNEKKEELLFRPGSFLGDTALACCNLHCVGYGRNFYGTVYALLASIDKEGYAEMCAPSHAPTYILSKIVFFTHVCSHNSFYHSYFV
mmetsp:Transcript_8109/g.11621  ORF Transcript_8109/g.11621 Transcript_8109/m.11621 type:complete len:119 (-) Transcript_8109:286-642(-)